MIGWQINNSTFRLGSQIELMQRLNKVTDKEGRRQYNYDIEKILGIKKDGSNRKIDWSKLPANREKIYNPETGELETRLGPLIRQTGDPSFLMAEIKEGRRNYQTSDQMRGGRSYLSKAQALAIRERGRGDRKEVTAEKAGVATSKRYGKNPYRDQLLGKIREEPSEVRSEPARPPKPWEEVPSPHKE